MSRLPHSGVRANAGFTLIEALVALLVLSVGLLGLAGLQLTSLRSTHGSALRSQATLLAYDIADRMRANREDAIVDGDYLITFGKTAAAGTVPGDDLVAWKTALATALPGGDGEIVWRGPPTHRVFTIRIQWEERDATNPAQVAGADPIIMTFETETQL